MNENEGLISGGMLDRLIELAVAKPTPQQVQFVHARPALREGEYRVYVDYEASSFAEIEKEYAECGFTDGRPFQKHPSCENIDETQGERVMIVMDFGYRVKSEEAITWMSELGYRPATHLEAYAFEMANLDPQRSHCIVALGSFTPFRMNGDCRIVAYLWHDGDGRDLGLYMVGHDWSEDHRFLFVRK